MNEFEFEIAPRLGEAMRWYVEDFIAHPNRADRVLAAQTPRHLEALGTQFAERVFAGSDGARLRNLAEQLHRPRVEIHDLAGDATRLPWELLRGTVRGRPLALKAGSWTYIRARDPDLGDPPPVALHPPARVLLVIARPQGYLDVPFRAVANGLLAARGRYRPQLQVLRPPTFRGLRDTLVAARDSGAPFDIVHFDGHGVYEDFGGRPASQTNRMLFARAPTSGARGYLVFENQQVEQNLQYVDGVALGDILREGGVRALVLNSCRTATTRAPTRAGDVSAEDETPPLTSSFADEACRRGVPLVVAMRYNVYAEMAREYVDALYAALARGLPVDEATAAARRALYSNRARRGRREGVGQTIEDWWVPVVIMSSAAGAERPQSATQVASRPPTLPPSISSRIPPRRAVGIDDAILMLERAFARAPIVALHGPIGSGKTVLAAEFAAWWQRTGGHTGSFRYSSLLRTGDLIARARSTEPLFWIWDDADVMALSAADAPSRQGSPQSADVDQAHALLDELRAGDQRLLLVTRADKSQWRGARCEHVVVPQLERQHAEWIALLTAIDADKHPLGDEVIHPIIAFSNGNPRIVKLMTQRALRDRTTSRAQAIELVEATRLGEADLDVTVEAGDDPRRSLREVVRSKLDTNEQRVLAILFLFQEGLDSAMFAMMAHPKLGHLRELAGLTEPDAQRLLDRCAGLGLMQCIGEGLYKLHPATPGGFREAFVRTYGTLTSRGGARACRAFVDAIVAIARQYAARYSAGAPHFERFFDDQYWNLQNARRLARERRWTDCHFALVAAVEPLYRNTSRSRQFLALARELQPEIMDDDGSRIAKGFDMEAAALMSWYAFYDQQSGSDDSAAEWAQRALAVVRRRVAKVVPQGKIANEKAATMAGQLAHYVHTLAGVEKARDRASSIALYEEVWEIAEDIRAWLPEQSRHLAAHAAFNLGMGFAQIPQVLDLTAAERWIRRSLELVDAGDVLALARSHGALGWILLSRFELAGGTKDRSLLAVAKIELERSRDLLPESALDDRAIANRQLGSVLSHLDEVEAMSAAYRAAITAATQLGERHFVRQLHDEFAGALERHGMIEEAREHRLILSPFGDVPTVFVGG